MSHVRIWLETNISETCSVSFIGSTLDKEWCLFAGVLSNSRAESNGELKFIQNFDT